jgi:hypothetical protein
LEDALQRGGVMCRIEAGSGSTEEQIFDLGIEQQNRAEQCYWLEIWGFR